MSAAAPFTPSAQIPLDLRLRDTATFANLLPGDNDEAVSAVWRCILNQGVDQLYLWGGRGTGKSHLLQAACHEAGERGEGCFYLPLEEAVREWPVGALQGLERMALLAVDDVQAVAGRHSWEEGLFNLYNRVREAGGRMLFAASARADEVGIGLPDLSSRLAWGLSYVLHEPDEAGKLVALRLHALNRGIHLPDEVGRYLIRHCRRDLHSLAAILERLDEASLVAKRRLTVPFVRQVLKEECR
ncbi:DnaA regulatory inactivator Hda [Endothiovibrio diazotrophicus]